MSPTPFCEIKITNCHVASNLAAFGKSDKTQEKLSSLATKRTYKQKDVQVCIVLATASCMMRIINVVCALCVHYCIDKSMKPRAKRLFAWIVEAAASYGPFGLGMFLLVRLAASESATCSADWLPGRRRRNRGWASDSSVSAA